MPNPDGTLTVADMMAEESKMPSMADFGSAMTKYANPLAMAANIISGFGRSQSGGVQNMQDVVQKYLASQTAAGASNKAQAPVATAPQPTAQTVPIPVAKPVTPIAPTYKADELVKLMSGAPIIPGMSNMAGPTDVPMLTNQGGALSVNPPSGVSEQVGTQTPMQVPTGIATMQPPSVQQMNVAPVRVDPTEMANLGWMTSPETSMGLTQKMIENSLARQKAGTEATTAQAHLMTADAQRQNAFREMLLAPGKMRHDEALTQKAYAETTKTQKETNPEFIGTKARLEAYGKGLGEFYADQEYAKSGYGKLALPADFVKDLNLPKGLTYGHAFSLLGRNNTEKLIENWRTASSRETAATTTAQGTIKAAAEQNKYKDMMMKAIDASLDSDRKILADINKNSYVPSDNPNLDRMTHGTAHPRTAEEAKMAEAVMRRLETNSQVKMALLSASLGDGKPVQMPVQAPTTPPAMTKETILAQYPKATDITITGNTAVVTIDGKRYKVENK